ncbi:formate/nitrite transporter family protein [Clostridioides difficile]|nr:formate/nitrite transporter family protein [Clostridioides difficile]
MSKGFLTPGETAQATISAGIKKANISTQNAILLGLFGGAFIGLGALGSIIVSQTFGKIDPGVASFLSAMVFPVGLMLVVVAGAELFTGNTLMLIPLMDKKITLGKMLRNWGLVYFANLVGSILLVALVFYSSTLTGDAATKAIAVAEAKVNSTIVSMFLKAILCNILVVLAVWMATASQDVVSKLTSCWTVIMLFVLCGFQHSVANMFFIPMGMALGANITMVQFITNLVFVTLGNIVGGSIIVGGIYYLCYVKNS